MIRSSVITAIVVVVAIATLASAAYIYQISLTREVIRLTWYRTGEFIGLNEELVINVDGSASYVSNKFGDVNLVLSRAEVEDLFNKAIFTTDRTYTVKPSAADHYTYKLTIRASSGTNTVEWVDASASKETLPKELGELQFHIESIIDRIRHQTGTSQDDAKRAVEIARNFIAQAPTFKFDGIPETLNAANIVMLESFPAQYIITITFDTRHTGYGNREGQALAQVITPHKAVVTVVRDNVVSAILDNRWDELKQTPA